MKRSECTETALAVELGLDPTKIEAGSLTASYTLGDAAAIVTWRGRMTLSLPQLDAAVARARAKS